MRKRSEPGAAYTTADMVFDRLHEQILTLELLPGTRMSEADVASRLGVSRQPVRDAFNRLANLGLLRVRPQRATEVRGFSMREIENQRFVRAAIELEVVSRACARVASSGCDRGALEALDANLARQDAAAAAGQTDRFHALDYDFHRLICDIGGHALAFETVERCKRAVDRLCMLSLGRTDEVTAVLCDHRQIVEALKAGAAEQARATLRLHLSRLDATIAEIHAAHSDYFE